VKSETQKEMHRNGGYRDHGDDPWFCFARQRSSISRPGMLYPLICIIFGSKLT